MGEFILKHSWKTTAYGIATIVIAIAGTVKLIVDNDPATNPDWNAVVASLTAGIGLIFARDNDKSSEQVGIRPVKLETPKGQEQ